MGKLSGVKKLTQKWIELERIEPYRIIIKIWTYHNFFYLNIWIKLEPNRKPNRYSNTLNTSIYLKILVIFIYNYITNIPKKKTKWNYWKFLVIFVKKKIFFAKLNQIMLKLNQFIVFWELNQLGSDTYPNRT